MSHEDPFLTLHKALVPQGEGVPGRGITNRFGAQMVVDLITQWLLSGYCFHMQTGTEDAPITAHGTLDDTLAVMVADNNSGVMIPLRFEVNIATFTTATLIQAMLEADMAKKRYLSGGTVFVPRQMNGAASGAPAANGTFFTIEGSDITAAAKSAVPDSVELARRTFAEDVIADPGNGLLSLGERDVFNINRQLPVIIPTPGSLVPQFGSATADVTGYAVLQFAQLPATLVW